MILSLGKRFSKSIAQVERFSFSSLTAAVNKLKSVAEAELEHELNNPEDYSQEERFFKENGWDVQYNDTVIELKKRQGFHQIHIVFNARAPLPIEEEEPGSNDQEQEQDASEVTVCLKKDGF